MNNFDMFVFCFVGFFNVLPAVFAGQCASQKGRSVGAGVFLGLILSWIGLLIVACWRKDHEEIANRKRAQAPQLWAEVSAKSFDGIRNSPTYDRGWFEMEQEPEPRQHRKN